MRITKDMATSRPEFFRNLDIALREESYSVSGNEISITGSPGIITMTLSPLPARKLSALLSLERWQVDMDFCDYDGSEVESFLERFDRAFQRGGG